MACRTIIRAVLLAALTAVLGAISAQAAFPGANGKIAFVSSRNSPGELFMMNSDGSQQGAIPTPTINRDPAWSANGQRLAFIGHAPNTVASDEVYLINADGTGRVRLTFDGGTKRSPTWSPDGTKIAYEDAGIQIAQVDGSGVAFLVAGSQPSWSPDGSELVFRGDGGLWTINADGTGLERLTTDNGEHPDDQPDWSADGLRIVFKSVGCTHFCSSDDGNILVVDRDGTNRTTLTSPSNIDSDPAWSPNGLKITFTRELGLSGQTSSREVFVMNADGTDQTQLTFNGGVDPATGWPTGPTDEDPTWQPLGAFDPYPRPGGGTPYSVQLVPAYEPCTSPNSEHVAPLAQPSCAPPVQASPLLTTSSTGEGSGRVRLDTVVGNPATPADEADLRISAFATNVLNAGGATAYSGTLLVRMLARITDKRSGSGAISATVADTPLSFPIACSAGSCNLNTTADTVVPGFVQEGGRTIVAARALTVTDAGPDGSVAGPACPPTCGTGDERPYLEQGAFAP